MLLTAANYLVLTNYDQLAFIYVGRQIARWRIVIVITSYSIHYTKLYELRANGATTRFTIVDDNMDEQAIRHDLIGNLEHRGDYVIVAYKRDAVGQRGGGHISPLGAYDADSDSFLVLDVNPASAGWVWMPAVTLIKGMRTFDTVENRGYILIQSP